MKKVFDIIKKIFVTNIVAIIGVAVLSLVLVIAFNINFFISFFLLLIAYFVLGFTVESAMHKYRVAKRRKSGKTAEEIKREAEIRAERRARGEELMRKHQIESAQAAREVRKSAASGRIGYASEIQENQNLEYIVPSKEGIDTLKRVSARKQSPFDVEPPADVKSSDNDANKQQKKPRSVKISYDYDRFRRTPPSDVARHEKETPSDSEKTESEAVNEDKDEVSATSTEIANAVDTAETAVEKDTDVTPGTESPEAISETENEDGDNTQFADVEVQEMEKESEDIARAVSERISSSRRKRIHVIRDVEELSEQVSASEEEHLEESVSGDIDSSCGVDYETEDSASVREEVVSDGVEDNIPTVDAVNASEEKLDELYSTQSEKEKSKIGGFFSKALSGLKKKRK
ncbi:MAG: hypothetical protein IJZ90_04310 [Clostridia bacterium]|nr:hypothetical protein [Clostridia bacterium]